MTVANESKISLRGISKVYPHNGEQVWALQSIDLDVQRGEFVCIVGPSGCGKSTLLHLIAGLDQASEGEILIDGKAVNGPGPDRILIFQELGLFPWLNVRQNVEFGLRMAGMPARQRAERARQYLRLVQLGRFENSYVHQLSGGMKQRVALARALAVKPAVLLMDEPFTALDAQTRDLLHEELEKIWAETGQTIIFITHNVREAVRLGTRVLLMSYRPGRIKREFAINLGPGRAIEHADVGAKAAEIQRELRSEIDKALAEEYAHA
jgi:NitT/TauT family transport system ATP-binding protein